MKLLLSACLLIAPAFGQSAWQWRDEVRRAHAEVHRAHAEALRAARSARMDAIRSAAQARAEARRAARASVRHERIWRF